MAMMLESGVAEPCLKLDACLVSPFGDTVIVMKANRSVLWKD